MCGYAHLSRSGSSKSLCEAVRMLPQILLYSRIVLALAILALSFNLFTGANYWVIGLMYLGILSDVFDGIVARKLDISSDSFRIQDTIIDLVFYMTIVWFIFSNQPNVLEENKVLIATILSLELLMYLISVIRFAKFPSPHAILSKFWGIYLVITFTLLLLGINGLHFTIALAIGIVVHADRVLIYLILKKWERDIPSSFHAYQLRKGKEISRNQLFNG